MVRDHEALGGDSDVPCRPVHIRAAGDDDGTYSDSDPSAAAESCREGSTRRSACGRYETRGGLAQRDRWEEQQSNNAADTLMNPNVSWNHRGWDIETLSWYDDVAGRVLLGFADAGARAAREARGVRHSGDDDMDSDIQEAIPPLRRAASSLTPLRRHARRLLGVYVGSFKVADGPAATFLSQPAVYSCQQVPPAGWR
jgi:hypothetical protein